MGCGKIVIGEWTPEGAGKCDAQSIPQRVGIRELPGICRYPDKCIGFPMKQGGTADLRFVLDRDSSVRDFLFAGQILGISRETEIGSAAEARGENNVNETMAKQKREWKNENQADERR